MTPLSLHPLLTLVTSIALALPQLQSDGIENIGLTAPRCKTTYTDFPDFNLTLAAERDLQSVGPFDIINCAHHTSDARYALATTRRFAAAAANDSRLGVDSEFGFAALFKSNNAAARVNLILSKIAYGTIPSRAGCYPGARPTVLCVNSNDVITNRMRELCNMGHPAYTNKAFPHVVILCPSVWYLPDMRASEVKCPTLDAKGKLTPNDGVIALNTQATIVHEFVHIYQRFIDMGDEAYNIQDAIELNEKDSLRNPSNYALYVAGKSSMVRSNSVV